MAHIKKLQSDRYQAQIRLKGLRPITRSFNTKKLALQYSREVEGNAELARSLGTPVTNVPTFREIVDEYMMQYQGKDPSTCGRLDYWITQFGDKPVTRIDEYMVDDGLVQLSRHRTGSTVNRYKSTLSAVFIYFIRHTQYKRLSVTNPVMKESVYPDLGKTRLKTDSLARMSSDPSLILAINRHGTRCICWCSWPSRRVQEKASY